MNAPIKEGYFMDSKHPNTEPVDKMARYVQVDNWIFEVKTVRAIRVDKYGKPYSAVANLTLNGDNGFIDGLLTRENEKFSRKDFHAFYKFCQQMEVKKVNFDRFRKHKLISERVDVQPVKQQVILKLVR
jgi:hypothetical protein